MIWANVNNDELKQFVEQMERLERRSKEVEVFFVQCARALAARLLTLVIPKTPVGNYEGGGVLRRGWISKTHEDAESGSGDGSEEQAVVWANSLPVTKANGSYTIQVVNPVYYASYVEFGHRTRRSQSHFKAKKAGNKGWVEGQYFLTIAENELKSLMPTILENMIVDFMGKHFKER